MKNNGLMIVDTTPASMNNLTVYLDSSVTYLNMHTSKRLDSATIKNDHFAFTRNMIEPAELILTISTKEYSGNRYFLSGNSEHVLFNLSSSAPRTNCFDKVIINGSKLTAEYDQLQAHQKIKFSTADSLALSKIRNKDNTPDDVKKAMDVMARMGRRIEEQAK